MSTKLSPTLEESRQSLEASGLSRETITHLEQQIEAAFGVHDETLLIPGGSTTVMKIVFDVRAELDLDLMLMQPMVAHADLFHKELLRTEVQNLGDQFKAYLEKSFTEFPPAEIDYLHQRVMSACHEIKSTTYARAYFKAIRDLLEKHTSRESKPLEVHTVLSNFLMNISIDPARAHECFFDPKRVQAWLFLDQIGVNDYQDLRHNPELGYSYQTLMQLKNAIRNRDIDRIRECIRNPVFVNTAIGANVELALFHLQRTLH